MPLARAGLDDGLVAHYPFDGNAQDTSGNGNDGTIIEAAAALDRFDQTDAAFAFDGIDDLIELPSLGNWGSALSFSFWTVVDSTDTGRVQEFLGSRQSGSGSTIINFDVSRTASEAVRLRVYSDGANSELASVSPLPLDEWVHIACVWDQANGTTIFINGALDASADRCGVGEGGASRNTNAIRPRRRPGM